MVKPTFITFKPLYLCSNTLVWTYLRSVTINVNEIKSISFDGEMGNIVCDNTRMPYIITSEEYVNLIEYIQPHVIGI